MPKANITVSIKNSTEESLEKVTAIIQNDILLYKTKDNTITKYNYKENTLIRENDEMQMKYIFDLKEETLGRIFIKDLNNYMNVKIKTEALKVNNHDIEIKFRIEEELFFFNVKEWN